MFPWLAYGHLMPYVQVSISLAQQGHRISFISTPKNIHRLRISSTSTSLSPLITFVELPMPADVAGLPQSTESTADIPIHKVPYLKKAYENLELPLFHVLENMMSDNNVVNWIVFDFVAYWLPRVATRLGVNSVFFSIFNATSLAFVGGQRQRSEDFTIVPKWVPADSDVAVAFKLHEMGLLPPAADESEDDKWIVLREWLDNVCT